MYNLNLDSSYSVSSYAKIVYKSLSEKSIITITDDGFVFAYIYGNHYLISYIGDKVDIVLPQSYEYLGETINSYGIYNNAFYYKYEIRSIVIPNSVTSIESNVFTYCSRLKTIFIPSSVTFIEYQAFVFSSLSEIYMEIEEEMGDWVYFENYSNAKIIWGSKR